MNCKIDYSFRIAITGRPKSGKSIMMKRFAGDEFSETYQPTIWDDFKAKILEEGDRIIKIQIWDTSGQEIF